MLRREWKTFLTAVMFLTRIRVPAGIGHHPGYLLHSPKYFPVIGLIVGGICAGVFLLFNRFLSPDIAILASMIAGILTTGAFHEDGFADVCDGFGGGWTREKILLIMKDSRIGAFGAIGLIMMFGAKFLLLRELLLHTGLIPVPATIFYDKYFVAGLMAAHSLSRLMPVLVMRFFEYAADPETSKSKPVANGKSTAGALVFATAAALLPFLFLPYNLLLAIPPVIFAAYLLARYFKKWIKGYTGDCLGAIQQVCELTFYFAFIILWKVST